MQIGNKLNLDRFLKGFTDYDSWANSSHGTLKITSWDKTNKRIVGQFGGVFYNVGNAADSIVVTNGQFNSSYTTK